MANKLEYVENAILGVLEQKEAVSMHELVEELGKKGHPESQVRGAVWALLSDQVIDVAHDYSLRLAAACV